MSKEARHWWESEASRKKAYSYQKLADTLKEEFEGHHKVLQETEEEAHVHVLWLRRMESAQQYIYEHFPECRKRSAMLGHIHELRKLAQEMLEAKQSS